jgi:hypothetical protein
MFVVTVGWARHLERVRKMQWVHLGTEAVNSARQDMWFARLSGDSARVTGKPETENLTC